jgi:hypothetical protein
MASTILTALTLGVMLFLSHMVSFVKIDYVLRWLVPLCFGLLTFAAILILVTLIATGSKKHEDVNELIYSSSIIDQTITSGRFFFFKYEIFYFYFIFRIIICGLGTSPAN